MLSDLSLIWVSWDGAAVRLSLALWKGPNALQQDGRRTESGVSSSLELLAWCIPGPSNALQQGLELLLCCFMMGGRSVTLSEPMCQQGLVRDHLFLKENFGSRHLRATNRERGECI